MYKLANSNNLCLVLLLSVIFIAKSDYAVCDDKTIKVRAEAWDSYTTDGQGYLFEIISAIYSPLGFDIDFGLCPWKRCIQDVIKGEADIIVGVYDNESFVGKGIITNQHSILHERVGVTFIDSPRRNWLNEKSLKLKTVASLRGLNYHHELSTPIKLIEVSK